MANIYMYSARLLLVLSLFIVSPGIAAAEDSSRPDNNIRVILDANPVEFSVPLFIENSSTLVQFRPIFEKMGLEISWDANNRKVIGRKQDTQIELQIDNPFAKVNGHSIALPVAPQIKEGYTFVPLRFISESVGAKVEWDGKRNTAIIYSKKEYKSRDGKFHFTAYGLWRNMKGLDGVEAQRETDQTVWL